jgi:hypothetical protein
MTLRGLPQQSVCRHAAGKHQEIRDFSRNSGGTSPTVAVMAASCGSARQFRRRRAHRRRARRRVCRGVRRVATTASDARRFWHNFVAANRGRALCEGQTRIMSAYTGSDFGKGAAAIAAGNWMVGPPSSWSRDQEEPMAGSVSGLSARRVFVVSTLRSHSPAGAGTIARADRSCLV